MIAEADHAVYFSAQIMKLFGNWISNSAANTAAYNANLFKTIGVCCNAERADKIMQAFSLRETVQFHGASADNLIDNGNSASFPVKVSNSKRNTLAVFAGAQDNKLARFCFAGNKRGADGARA